MPRGKNGSKYGESQRESREALDKAQLLDNGYNARRYESDPSAADRLYTDEEADFLRAAEAYREAEGKRFLTATDYLQVLKGLGYRKG